MQTHLAPEYQNTPDGLAAEAILRKCVHCGFCLPACPTYQELGQEMDTPRGRIVLMKEVLEGTLTLTQALPHVDRCLGCLACETACPSGVKYRELISPFRDGAIARFLDKGIQTLDSFSPWYTAVPPPATIADGAAAGPDGAFQFDVALLEGDNRFVVEARDLLQSHQWVRATVIGTEEAGSVYRLNLSRVLPSLRDMVARRVQPGDVIRARVKEVRPDGAFFDVLPGVQAWLDVISSIPMTIRSSLMRSILCRDLLAPVFIPSYGRQRGSVTPI